MIKRQNITVLESVVNKEHLFTNEAVNIFENQKFMIGFYQEVYTYSLDS